MSVKYPIAVERNSTFKMKLTLALSTGVFNLNGVTFSGEVKNSIYDAQGFNFTFEAFDLITGSFIAVLDSATTDQFDFTEGVYTIRYVAQDGKQYRLIEGNVSVNFEGEEDPVDITGMDVLNIYMDPTPTLSVISSIGLPGPKLTYADLTESDKENLRQGVYEAVEDQVAIAVDAKEAALQATSNAQAATSLIQNTYLPQAQTAATDAAIAQAASEAARDLTQASAATATLKADESADLKEATEVLYTDTLTLKQYVEGAKTDIEASEAAAATSASNAATSAIASAGSATSSSGFRDEAEGFRDEAEIYAQQAKNAAESAFQSGGVWEPTAGNEYPTIPTTDTRWTLKAYTFTSGDLTGLTSVDGDTLLYEVSLGTFEILYTGSAILGNPIAELISYDGNITYNGPSATINSAFVGARPNTWVPDYSEVLNTPDLNLKADLDSEVSFSGVKAPSLKTRTDNNLIAKGSIATEIEVGDPASTNINFNLNTASNLYVKDATTSYKVYTEANPPTPSDIGALPLDHQTEWATLLSVPETASRWPTADEAGAIGYPLQSSATSGDITGSSSYLWLAPTASSSSIRTVMSDVTRLLVKDTEGNAGLNHITLIPESGYTINGDTSEVIDINNGWVLYYLVGTDYKTVMGG